MWDLVDRGQPMECEDFPDSRRPTTGINCRQYRQRWKQQERCCRQRCAQYRRYPARADMASDLLTSALLPRSISTTKAFQPDF